MICLLRKLLNYKHYNLRGDVIVTTDGAGNVLSQSHYETYGEHADYGVMPSDKHRANTKVEDADTNLLLEGHRYRLLGAGIFLSPDPLEYVDGLHRYAYCGFNPWGRFDPLGLNWDLNRMKGSPAIGRRNVSVPDIGNGIKGVWIAFTGKSDQVMKSYKDYFVAIEINFSCKNSSGLEVNSSIVVARPLTREDVIEHVDVDGNKSYTMSDMKLKGYAQDGGNYVEMIGNLDEQFEQLEKTGKVSESLSVKVRPGLYKGNLEEAGFNKSNIKYNDWDDENGGYETRSQKETNQTRRLWSAYSQSTYRGDPAYVTDNAKNLEDVSKLKGVTPIDISENTISDSVKEE